MARKPRFTIGQRVRVTATASLFYTTQPEDWPEGKKFQHERLVERTPCEPWTGWIVGAKRRPLGTYVPPFNNCGPDEWDDPDPAYLETKGTVLVWRVTTGLLNKVTEVLDEDVEAVTEDNPPRVPWKHYQPIPDGVRELMRQQAGEMRRKNGKFVK